MHTAAIIGISGYGRFHLLLALDQLLQGRLKLLAATIVNQEEEAVLCGRLRGLGCALFTTTEAMWAEFHGRIDLCFIPTGIHQHAPMTLQALRAGANVFVEKPLAGSLAEILEIQAAERAHERFVAVGFQDTYSASTFAIKERLLNGELGELRDITVKGLWPRSSAYYSRNRWTGRLHVDGHPVFDSPANNACAHHLHIALFWAGATRFESATVGRVEAELYRARPIESFDTCCVRATLSDDVTLHAYLTHSCGDDRPPSLVITTTLARISWMHEQSYEIEHLDGRRERARLHGTLETRLLAGDAVVARLDDSSRFVCGTRHAAAHTRLVEAIHAAGPINTVNDLWLQRRETPAGNWVAISGIEALIDQAAIEGALFSEFGAPWARTEARPDLVALG